MHIGLDKRGRRAAPPGAPQHGVRQVNGDQSGRRGALAQAWDERPGAAADLQDRLRCTQLGGEGRQQPPQHLLPVGRLLLVPVGC